MEIAKIASCFYFMISLFFFLTEHDGPKIKISFEICMHAVMPLLPVAVQIYQT